MPAPEIPRSSLSIGWEWSSRISSIALEFVLPIVAGWWLDRTLGTTPGAIIVGAVLGFALGLTHLLRIAREAPGYRRPARRTPDRTTDRPTEGEHHGG